MKRTICSLMCALLIMITISACSAPAPIDLTGVKVLVLIDDGFNYTEATSTIKHLEGAGATVTVSGMAMGETKPYDSDTERLSVELLIADARADDFDSLYVPGGYSADTLKNYMEVKDLVSSIYEQGKVVAAICLGPVVLGHAGVLEGVHVSAVNAVEVYNELIGLGAVWVNAGGVVNSHRVVTGRALEDLPFFNQTYAKAIAGWLSTTK